MTILYLVLSTWTPGTEVRHDLEEFLRTTELARSVSDTPERIADLIPEIPNHHSELRSKLSRKIGRAVLAIAPLRVRPLEPLPNDVSTIGTQWEQLKNQKWELQTLRDTDEDLSEIRELIRNNGPYLIRLFHELQASTIREQYDLSDFDIHLITTPFVIPEVVSWNVDDVSNFATIEMHIFIPTSRSQFRATQEDFVDILGYMPLSVREYLELDVVHRRSLFGPYRFSINTNEISLSPTLENRFPDLHTQLDKLGELTPDKALAWAASLQVSEIRGSNPRFLGTAIRGEHLGIVGPSVILILQAYLLLMLYNLLVSIRRIGRPSLDSSWVLLIKGPSSMVFAVSTLVLSPSIATGLTVWRLTPTDWYVWVVCTLVMVGIGIWIMVLGQRIRNVADD